MISNETLVNQEKYIHDNVLTEVEYDSYEITIKPYGWTYSNDGAQFFKKLVLAKDDLQGATLRIPNQFFDMILALPDNIRWNTFTQKYEKYNSDTGKYEEV